MARYLIPLGVFVALVALLWVGLGLNPREVPSPFIGKPAPQFSLPRLEDPAATLSNADFKGHVSLFNVWATWCVSCRAEHEVLVELAQSKAVPIYGLNYKDERADALDWLNRLGNPYVTNGFDADGRAGIDWGVYGTPETFIIDRDGIVRHKHVGPLTRQVVEEEILPLVAKLQGGQG